MLRYIIDGGADWTKSQVRSQCHRQYGVFDRKISIMRRSGPPQTAQKFEVRIVRPAIDLDDRPATFALRGDFVCVATPDSQGVSSKMSIDGSIQ